jgi:hypothetical protein
VDTPSWCSTSTSQGISFPLPCLSLLTFTLEGKAVCSYEMCVQFSCWFSWGRGPVENSICKYSASKTSRASCVCIYFLVEHYTSMFHCRSYGLGGSEARVARIGLQKNGLHLWDGFSGKIREVTTWLLFWYAVMTDVYMWLRFQFKCIDTVIHLLSSQILRIKFWMRNVNFNPLSTESLNPQYVRGRGANFTIIKMFYNWIR